MSYPMYAVAALSLTLLVGSPALAKDVGETTHDGKVVSITAEKLVMEDKQGKEHSHVLKADAKVCLDGKIVKAESLKPGYWIRVTIKNDDKNVAARIEGLENNKEFSVSHDGKMVSLSDDKMIMTDKEGKEIICTLARDGVLTIDGKVARFVDLKAGTRIRVTTFGDGKKLTNRIEAIVANDDFAKLN